MMVEPQPRSAFVMVQAKFVLELLMRLLACPAGLDRANQRPSRRIGRVIGEVIFALATGARFAHEPCGLARKMLPMRYQITVSNAHAHSSKVRAELAFGATAPRTAPQSLRPQHVNHLHHRHARYRRFCMLGWAPHRRIGWHIKCHISWIDLLCRLHTHRPT